MSKITLIHDDCLVWLRVQPDESIHCCVTDAPYGIKILSKRWDYKVPSVELWTEVLRVLKPGGTLLCFGGPKTSHRTAVNIEDAGFRLIDTMMWLYGTGMGRGRYLAPGYEPIVVAVKGVGNLFIDSCRTPEGRYPKNVIHDGSPEVEQFFPQLGKAGKAIRHKSGGKNCHSETKKPPMPDMGYRDEGSASRFFYCAKPSKQEKQLGKHATQKPLALMRWLVRLVCPPDGVVLDPFMGSGTTGVACREEGFDFIGVERELESYETAVRRC